MCRFKDGGCSGSGSRRSAPSTTTDPGHEMHLAVRLEPREPVVLVDLAVDGDREAVVEVGGEVGEAFPEPAHELENVGGVHLEAAPRPP